MPAELASTMYLARQKEAKTEEAEATEMENPVVGSVVTEPVKVGTLIPFFSQISFRRSLVLRRRHPCRRQRSYMLEEPRPFLRASDRLMRM